MLVMLGKSWVLGFCPHKILEGKTDKRQTFLSAKTLHGKQELGTRIYNAENVRKELAHAIILHEYPLSIVIILVLEGTQLLSNHYLKFLVEIL
jgi:hypothetical protein